MRSIAAIIMLMAVQVADGLKCEADHDCLQEQYCYGQPNRTRACAPCVSCAWHKRAVLAKPTCAQSALDCGDCLPGFQEEPLTSSKRHYCTPIPLPETTATSPHVSGAAPSVYLVGSIVFLIAVIICVTSFMWFRRKRTSTTTNAFQDVEDVVCHNHPPPYEETGNHIALPLLETITVADDIPPAFAKENESSFSLQVDVKSEQSLAQANPFKRAREPYYDTNNYSNSDQESSSSGVSDSDNYPSPNAPDLNDEETMPSTWTYHDNEVPTTDNAVVGEDFNDSGLSMSSSNTTSTGSLVDPLSQPGEMTVLPYCTVFPAMSFAGYIAPSTRVTSHKQEQSCESPSAMKRAKLNSSPIIGSTDSDEACQPDTPLDRVMESAITEDRNDSKQSTSSSRTTYNPTLPDSTRLMAGQGTMVFSFSFTDVPDADDRSNNEPATQRVSINMCQHSFDNGSRSTRVGPNISSADDTEEDFVDDDSSQPHVPPDRVIV